MILEVEPLIYNTSNSRIALFNVINSLPVKIKYSTKCEAENLTIELSEEDAMYFALAGVGWKVADLLTNGWF
jgi:hypothetical protein